MLQKVQEVDVKQLSAHSAVSMQVLQHALKVCQDGVQYGSHLMPYNYYEGPDHYFPTYTLERMLFETQQHYENYLSRLQAFPKQVCGCIFTHLELHQTRGLQYRHI